MCRHNLIISQINYYNNVLKKNITFNFLQSKYRKDRTITFPITPSYT